MSQPEKPEPGSRGTRPGMTTGKRRWTSTRRSVREADPYRQAALRYDTALNRGLSSSPAINDIAASDHPASGHIEFDLV
jgi:hypothetical protein